MQTEPMDSEKQINVRLNSRRNAYEFHIAGMPFRLKTTHGEKVVKELVALVDEKITQALVATKSGSFQSAAVLAALTIADEMLQLKSQANDDLDSIESRAMAILQDLKDTKNQPK